MDTLALVIPCKNEYRRLDTTAFLQAIEDYPYLTFLFVDDGSTDETAEKLAFLERASPAIQAIYLPQNRGKAEAVRAGMQWLLKNTSCDVLGFWDADLATPLNEIPRFMSALANHQAVIGSRWPHLGAAVDRKVFRACTGVVMKKLIRYVLGAHVYDTQCGAKIFRRDLAAKVFHDSFLSKWLFDVEVLARIGVRDLDTSVDELPLAAWRDVPGSKVRLVDSFRIFTELFRIYLHNSNARLA